MTDSAWIALAAGSAAIVLNGVLLLVALRRWRTFRRTLDAADALVDVHLERMEQRTAVAGSALDATVASGGRLGAATSRFGASWSALSFLLGRVPEERRRLRAQLLDAVLPTSDGAARSR